MNLNMDHDKEDTEALLKAGIRKIRNIEFNNEDCEALLRPGMKLKGPAINALGALFQQQAEQKEGACNPRKTENIGGKLKPPQPSVQLPLLEVRIESMPHRIQVFNSNLSIYSELPNLAAKNVNAIYQLRLGSFVIMRNEARMYIGKVIDMYKKGSSGRYGSLTKSDNLSELQALSLVVYLPLIMARNLPHLNLLLLIHLLQTPGHTEDSDISESEADDSEPPIFSGKFGAGEGNLHTYATTKTLLYHLGPDALVPLRQASNSKQSGTLMVLSTDAEKHWISFNKKAVGKVLQKLVIRLPGTRSAPKE